MEPGSEGTWPFSGPALDATPSLAINALTTDVIIDMDCDVPENKHLSHVLVVQVRGAHRPQQDAGSGSICRRIALSRTQAVGLSAGASPSAGRRQWVYLQAHRPQQDAGSGSICRRIALSRTQAVGLSAGASPSAGRRQWVYLQG
ncbi:hypothetical protein CesoFtcFv8_013322 [Champsocephalus esox]|uniref:Uncharacterized protein n=1 Tax=Champsocephalus esox TaxID=159716 RepID=A0AAN8GUS9_9TELE|nr:hypothetical protein CesoFtcFv8_013322 [Champsocephalus esox]